MASFNPTGELVYGGCVYDAFQALQLLMQRVLMSMKRYEAKEKFKEAAELCRDVLATYSGEVSYDVMDHKPPLLAEMLAWYQQLDDRHVHRHPSGRTTAVKALVAKVFPDGLAPKRLRAAPQAPAHGL